jgi:hypothetical protein
LFPGASLALCGLALGVLAGGCGGAQRNAHEPTGIYKVEVLHARFPAKQAIAHDTKLTLVVRNAGARTIPNVAVTLDSFSYASTYPKLAASKRPVWIVNTGPGAIATHPAVQTAEFDPPWALGALAPGASKIFVWRVTPVKTGVHTVDYAVAADLDGKARTRLVGGGLPRGSFVAYVAPVPPSTHFNPETGQVVPGPPPVPAAPQPAVP